MKKNGFNWELFFFHKEVLMSKTAMKKTLTIVSLIMLHLNSYCQNNNKASLEIGILYNYVFTEKGGFGATINPLLLNNKKVNMLLGLEYFQGTRKSEDTIYERYNQDFDLTYKYNYISMPLGVRINFGKGVKIFCESGLSLDAMIYGKVSGTRISWGPPGIPESTNDFEDFYMTMPNIGIFVGPGVVLPGENASFFFKTDFHYSFTPSFRDEVVEEHTFSCLMFLAGVKF
jgi:hypothetical protein